MKHLIVYASADFTSRLDFERGLDQFLESNGWRAEKVCLNAPYKHVALRHIVRAVAIARDGIYYDSSTKSPSASAVRAKLLNGADGALIFWDGVSRGTRDMIDAVEAKVPAIPFAVHML